MTPDQTLLPHAGRGGSRGASKPPVAEAGFTMIETVMACVLMGGLLATLSVFFIGVMNTTSSLQRRQSATVIASQVLENAKAVSAQDQNGCNNLTAGRTQAAVEAQWNARPLPAGVDNTQNVPAWADARCTGTVTLPLTGLPSTTGGAAVDPVEVGGLPYHVETFIGRCQQKAKPGGGETCTLPIAAPVAGRPSPPTMYRVTAVVSWTAQSDCGSACQYSASTLIDGTGDTAFNVRDSAAPFAKDDNFCVIGRTPTLINMIENDSGTLGDNPVVIVTPPSKGRFVGTPASGIVWYVRTNMTPGDDSFTYRLSDVNGSIAQQTPTVTIQFGNKADGC